MVKAGDGGAGPVAVQASRAQRRPQTREEILDVAERLVQLRGFNGFSYADVASELDISKAALHHHFTTKADLGEALIARYTERFEVELVRIAGRDADAALKLAAYAELYAAVLRDGRMCLCGMLAAEHETLPEPMRGAVVAFMEANERWLAGVLERGTREGSLRLVGTPAAIAASILGGLQGAMLLARSYGDTARFRDSAEQLFAGLTGGSPSTRAVQGSAHG